MSSALPHRYSLLSQVWDMALSLPTLLVVVLILSQVTLPWWWALILIGFALASVWLFGRAVFRSLASYDWDTQGLRAQTPLGQHHFDWNHLAQLQSRYYGTRWQRNTGAGRISLVLRFVPAPGAKRQTIELDSYLDDFQDLAALAESKAQALRLSIDGRSQECLLLLASRPQ